ncbi:lysophospholipase A [Rhizodiscina lignyota]|uniref:Lysophospholipase A n=1 Tax=Rhizodiscina lignyota TaxID=1504668 RepID=A0A9P4IIA7_9PEZI|nr:lysophospholipase A [Rhizodiscina lignyota]
MRSPLLFSVSLSLLPYLVDGSPTHRGGPLTWRDIRHLVTFGDSYTYVQGTRGHVNSTFIGDLQNLAFTPEQLLTDYIVQNQTGTAEGGPNWVEYLTGCGLKPGHTLPRTCDLQLWDFAFGGSDVSEEFEPLHHPYTVSYVNQVKQYIDYGHDKISYHGNREFLDSTLVAVWIGINDSGDSGKYNVSFPAWYANLTSTIFDSLSDMYALGYTQYMVLTLPPMNRRPGLWNSSDPVPSALQIEEWDTALNNSAKNFAAQHEKAEVRVYDAGAFLSGLLDEPDKYGFKITTDFCQAYDQPDIDTNYASYGCLPLWEYFWYNSGHMTTHVHKLLAADIKSFLQKPTLYGS